MSPEAICSLLKEKFGDAVTGAELDAPRPYVVVEASKWPEIAAYLRDEPRLRFTFLRCITAVDMLADDKLASIYDLMSVGDMSATEIMTVPHELAVRVVTERANPKIPSVAHVWPAADWHEREAYDMMGIVYENHPRLERILCPEDWEGYPLRKDYEFPVEYHGIPGTTEHELPSPRH